MHACLAALQFLTRLPVPVNIPFTNATVARSLVFFPVAGVTVGLLVSGGYMVMQPLLPPMTAAVLLVVLWTAFTGGLHMDGWMDTADGVLSHRPREQKLIIMKDSRVGAMGVIAGVLLLLLKVSALSELLDRPASVEVLLLLASIPVWSRVSMAASIPLWPLARGAEGMAGLFAWATRGHAAAALAMGSALLAVAYACAGVQLLQLGLFIGSGLLVSALVTVFVAGRLSKSLGGLTGDTYGAINESVEAALLIALLIGLKLQLI
ncbi:adenosylcobinamide-GDP ribazoletransferase [Paenibacillaceae bacterium]|nr:adenosylcobinamide-GDP ribazoletransferase [Paenibacillaceae bacterium]